MSYLIRWIPTFAAVAILAIAGFILDASNRRDKRRAQRRGARGSGLGSGTRGSV